MYVPFDKYTSYAARHRMMFEDMILNTSKMHIILKQLHLAIAINVETLLPISRATPGRFTWVIFKSVPPATFA